MVQMWNGLYALWYNWLAPIQMWTCKVLKLPMFLKPDHSSALDLLTIKNFNPHILISSGPLPCYISIQIYSILWNISYKYLFL